MEHRTGREGEAWWCLGEGGVFWVTDRKGAPSALLPTRYWPPGSASVAPEGGKGYRRMQRRKRAKSMSSTAKVTVQT